MTNVKIPNPKQKKEGDAHDFMRFFHRDMLEVGD
jgi:hypothetical protein